MKVLMISSDSKIFEDGSAVRQRMVEYGSLFDVLKCILQKRVKFEIVHKCIAC